jgi:MFS family permease
LILQLEVPESYGGTTEGPIDYVGAGLQALGLAGITYGFIAAPDLGFANPMVVGALAGGVVALAAFILVEARSPRPLMPLPLFRSRTFSGTNLLTLFLYGALNVSLFFLSLNIVQIQGYSLALAGVVFMPFALVLMGLSRWAGGLADKYGPRPLLIAGPLVVGTGFLWMAFQGVTAGPAQYWVTFFPAIVLMGIGMGLTVAPLSTAVMNSLATRQAGTASGVNNAVARIAGVLAIAVVGAIALSLFASALETRTAQLGLSPAALTALQAQTSRLGAATVPPQVGADAAAAVAAAIKQAFVDANRVVMLICTALAWVGALLAGWLVERPASPA